MTDDIKPLSVKHAKITGQVMRNHWGPIVDRIADEIADPRDAQIRDLIAENEALRHDLERYMTIANEHVNEANRLREALAHIAFSGADGPYGHFGEALNEHQMRRVAKAALQEQSK